MGQAVSNICQRYGGVVLSLQTTKQVVAELPTELQTSHDDSPTFPQDPNYPSPANEFCGVQSPDHYGINGFDNRPVDYTGPEDQRRIQFRIQKANIWASQLSTRLHLVEKYCSLHKMHNRNQTSYAWPGLIAPASNNFDSSQYNLSITEGDMANPYGKTMTKMTSCWPRAQDNLSRALEARLFLFPTAIPSRSRVNIVIQH